MGAPLSKESFAKKTDPILSKAKSVSHLSFFKPQVVKQRTDFGQVHQAFFTDGTIAGSLRLNIFTQPVALRGVFFVDEETREVVCDCELSITGPLIAKPNSSDPSQRFYISAFSQMELLEGRPSSDPEDYQVEMLAESVQPEDLLPPVATSYSSPTASSAGGGGMNNSGFTAPPPSFAQSNQAEQYSTQSQAAMLASLANMSGSEGQSVVDNSSPSSSRGGNSARGLGGPSSFKAPPQGYGSSIQPLGHSPNANAAAAAAAGDYELGGGIGSGRRGGGSRGSSRSPMRSPRGHLQEEKRMTLFDRLGGHFTIPQDEKSLRAVFESYDADKSGFVERAEISNEFLEFQAQMGLEMTERDLEAIFHRYCGRDKKLNFQEFCYFLSSASAHM